MGRPHCTGKATSLLLATLCLLCSAHAGAESSAEEAARSAFEQGRQLAAQGDYPAACSRFEQSMALLDAIGTAYNLADCEEHRGHFARAQQLFSLVARRARELEQPSRERLASERASALDSKLSLLELELPAGELTLELDGRVLPDEARRAAISLEPGSHRLLAFAVHKRTWSKRFDVPRPGLWFTISVPKLEDDAAAGESRTKRVTSRPAPAQRRSSGSSSRSSSGLPAGALVLAGVGIASGVAGGVFAWRYFASNADAKATCPSGYGCPPEQISRHSQLVEDAKTARSLSYLAFGAGGAALIGAAVLSFTMPGEHQVSARAASVDGAWFTAVSGRF